MSARDFSVRIEPGPDGARGLGGAPQTYGWVVVDEQGEWLGFSCCWYDTPEAARNVAVRLFGAEAVK